MTNICGLYTHYTGLQYEVIDIAYDSRDTQMLVLYRSLAESKIRETGQSLPVGTLWVRPYVEFFGQHNGVQRFTKVDPAKK